MKFEQKFINLIQKGFKVNTIRKKPYNLGIIDIQDVNGENVGLKVEITACQKVKRIDFLKHLEYQTSSQKTLEYGFFDAKAAFKYYEKYLKGYQYVGEEFCYAHKFEVIGVEK